MSEDFSNVYEDRDRAASYAKLAFPGTYHLAYRDLPAIIAQHVPGGRALDFGCGTGRSTRFVRDLGFETVWRGHLRRRCSTWRSKPTPAATTA